MTCSFTLSHEGATYELVAAKVADTETLETWHVSSRRDKNAFIVFSNDRPLLHNSHLYTARYEWTVLQGDPLYSKMVLQITTYLEYHIKGLWRPPKKGKGESKPVEANTQGKLF